MGAEKDYAYRWGVEDRQFGKGPFDPSAPITPDVRERYMAGYDSSEARSRANRNLVDAEAARKRKVHQSMLKDLGAVPARPKGEHRAKRKRHEHGADW